MENLVPLLATLAAMSPVLMVLSSAPVQRL
jgi:hypothetical protein